MPTEVFSVAQGISVTINGVVLIVLLVSVWRVSAWNKDHANKLMEHNAKLGEHGTDITTLYDRTTRHGEQIAEINGARGAHGHA